MSRLIREMMFTKFKIQFETFSDIEFIEARSARNVNRRQLQTNPFKKKSKSAAVSNGDYNRILDMWDEDRPEGLFPRFFPKICLVR